MLNSEEIKNVWEQIKRSFVEDNKFASSTVDLWFSDLYIHSFTKDEIVLFGPSEYKISIINNKYVKVLEEAFEDFLGHSIKVSVLFESNDRGVNLFSEDTSEKTEEKDNFEETEKNNFSPFPSFNFEYTFDNFIEGSSNNFARAACWAVAQNVVNAEEGHTASQYNPLFLYGPSGIGKTHLMYAITNKIKKENPDANIVYIKGEDFTNQLIDSLSRQSMSQFREKYRKCDILMIDDIQFIASKVATQEEFFHTFNALYENEKQIIMTSDRPPREIPDLERRLVSRFEMGLLADIQPPDLELRMAIIKKKAEQGKITIPDDVLTFLAENLRSNIRQIEGAIKKLSALIFLSGKEITIEVAKNLLHELLGGAEPVSVTIDKIFLSVYKKYGFKKDELIGAKRTKDLAKARHITIYLIRKITEMSLPNIGKIFNRDHSTVMASIDIVEKKLISDNMIVMELEEITKEVETGEL